MQRSLTTLLGQAQRSVYSFMYHCQCVCTCMQFNAYRGNRGEFFFSLNWYMYVYMYMGWCFHEKCLELALKASLRMYVLHMLVLFWPIRLLHSADIEGAYNVRRQTHMYYIPTDIIMVCCTGEKFFYPEWCFREIPSIKTILHVCVPTSHARRLTDRQMDKLRSHNNIIMVTWQLFQSDTSLSGWDKHSN